MSAVQRFAIGIEFDGREFRGWQTQQVGVASVQLTVEKALSTVANHPVIVHAAGRTDAGVHASGMIAHFDTVAQRGERNWLMGVNTLLPDAVTLRWIQPVSADFHARFQAKARRYNYLIYNSPRRSSHLVGRATWHYHPLNVEHMHEAAQQLVGVHDFTAFRAVACQSNRPVRDVHFIRVQQSGALIRLDIQADGFLHHMVRNIVGVLLPIGQDEQPATWAAEVLHSKNRKLAGVTAPPDGLYFVDALYDEPLVKDTIGPAWLSTWPLDV